LLIPVVVVFKLAGLVIGLGLTHGFLY